MPCNIWKFPFFRLCEKLLNGTHKKNVWRKIQFNKKITFYVFRPECNNKKSQKCNFAIFRTWQKNGQLMRFFHHPILCPKIFFRKLFSSTWIFPFIWDLREGKMYQKKKAWYKLEIGRRQKMNFNVFLKFKNKRVRKWFCILVPLFKKIFSGKMKNSVIHGLSVLLHAESCRSTECEYRKCSNMKWWVLDSLFCQKISFE